MVTVDAAPGKAENEAEADKAEDDPEDVELLVIVDGGDDEVCADVGICC